MIGCLREKGLYRGTWLSCVVHSWVNQDGFLKHFYQITVNKYGDVKIYTRRRYNVSFCTCGVTHEWMKSKELVIYYYDF